MSKLQCQKTNKLLTYFQIDYFHIAATAFVLLSGSYMKLKRDAEGKHFPNAAFKR